jgi:hypothetical protein
MRYSRGGNPQIEVTVSSRRSYLFHLSSGDIRFHNSFYADRSKSIQRRFWLSHPFTPKDTQTVELPSNAGVCRELECQ